MTDQIIIIWKKGEKMHRTPRPTQERTNQKKKDIWNTLETSKIQECLSNRKLVANCKFNPFMKDNNYVDDLAIRDKYLRPQNSKAR